LILRPATLRARFPISLGVRLLAGVEAEVELGEVARQVLWRDVMVRPVNRPLQLREVGLGVVYGHVAAHVLARFMVYPLVVANLLAMRR
jgi:hypothetical protein